jgi:hypothetical protein
MTLPFSPLAPLIRWLRPLLEHLSPANPIKTLQWLADFLDAARRLRDKVGYHRVHEILDYDAPLATRDPAGKRSALARGQTVRCVQKSVVAVHSHARTGQIAPGRLLPRYHWQVHGIGRTELQPDNHRVVVG